MTNSILRKTARLFFGFAALAMAVSAQSMFDKINDFDGDGKADFAIVRGEGGLLIWHIWQTSGGYKRVHWGAASDRVSAADYDGDGKTDVGIARTSPSFGSITTFFLGSQTDTIGTRTVGGTITIYVNPQDYDGDGKADPSCTTEPVPLIYRSSTTGNLVAAGFNSERHFFSTLGDLTGDGRAELTGWDVESNQPEVTVFVKNLVTDTTSSFRWGVRNDEFVAGDFDGDNKGDIAIFRKSTGDWWWIRSSDSVVSVIHWGVDGDRPVAADYDGDGISDQAVYRPASPNGIYYVNGSQTGFQAFAWGVPDDFLIRYGDLNGVFFR